MRAMKKSKMVAQPVKSKAMQKAKKTASPSKKTPFKEPWPEKYEKIIQDLNTPPKIQAYIDSYPYDPSSEMRSVWQAFEDGKAHCFAGCLIAAYCLNRHGY